MRADAELKICWSDQKKHRRSPRRSQRTPGKNKKFLHGQRYLRAQRSAV